MEIIEFNGKKYAEITNTPDRGILEVGNKVFIRTITYHHVGLITHVSDKEIRLAQSSWVADSGRWHTALQTGELSEVEPSCVPMGIRMDTIVDYFLWKHELPKHAK